MKHRYLIYLLCLFLVSVNTVGQVDTIEFTSSDLFILDGHNHQGFPNFNEDSICAEMKLLKSLGYDAIVFPLPVERAKRGSLSFAEIRKDIQKLKELSEKSSCFYITDSLAEFPGTNEDQKIHCQFALEYFHGLFDRNSDLIEQCKNLGIVYITLIDNPEDSLFFRDRDKNLLTAQGKQLIRVLNKANIIIDISHLNEKQMIEVLHYSRSPVMASHTNIRNVASINYNLSDSVLIALQQNNGLIMLSFNTNGLYAPGEDRSDPVKKFVDHIDYLKSVNGIDQVGIGTDLQAFGEYIPEKLYKENIFEELKVELVRRNYSEDDIEKIFYGNYIRFIERNNHNNE